MVSEGASAGGDGPGLHGTPCYNQTPSLFRSSEHRDPEAMLP